jgi:hypothetical protein
MLVFLKIPRGFRLRLGVGLAGLSHWTEWSPKEIVRRRVWLEAIEPPGRQVVVVGVVRPPRRRGGSSDGFAASGKVIVYTGLFNGLTARRVAGTGCLGKGTTTPGRVIISV